jgi:hypothetical protein
LRRTDVAAGSILLVHPAAVPGQEGFGAWSIPKGNIPRARTRRGGEARVQEETGTPHGDRCRRESFSPPQGRHAWPWAISIPRRCDPTRSMECCPRADASNRFLKSTRVRSPAEAREDFSQ